MWSSRLLKLVQKTTPVIVGRNPKPTTTIIRRPPPQSSSSSTIPPPPPPPPVIPPPRPSIIPPLSHLRALSSYIPPPLIPHLIVRQPASYFTPASSSIVTPPLLSSSSSSSSLIRNIYPNSFIHHEAVIPEDGGFLRDYFPPNIFGSLSRAQSKVIQFLMSGGMGFFVGGPSLAQINLYFQTFNAMREAYEALQPYGLALAERIKAECLSLFKKKKNNNNEIQQPQQVPQQQQQLQEERITVPFLQLLSEPNRIKFACMLFGVTDEDHIAFQFLDNRALVINAFVASGKDLDPLTATLDLPPGDFSNAQTNTKFSKKNGVFLIDIQGFQITNSSSSSSS